MTAGHWPRPASRPQDSGLLRKLARFGYLVKGALYTAIGVLALLAAFGKEGGQVGGQGDVVRTAAHGPFGEVLLVLIGVGLLSYAVWHVVEAVLDVHRDGTSGKGLAKRAGYVGSGLVNGAVGLLALDMVIGRGGGSNSEPATYVGKMMEAPLGAFLIAAIGVGFVAFGIQQLTSGWTKKFTKQLSLQQMDSDKRRWVVRAGQSGLIARGVVFGIIGVFLVYAVFTHDPSQALGLGGALHTIAGQPFGAVLFVIVAAGLACYGIYQMLFAKYGRLVG